MRFFEFEKKSAEKLDLPSLWGFLYLLQTQVQKKNKVTINKNPIPIYNSGKSSVKNAQK